MPDPTPVPAVVPAVDPAPETAETDAPGTPAEPAADISGLPEAAQTQIRALRAEAAKYRTRAKSLEDANKSELQKALDALEASKTELNQTRTELSRNKVMAEHGLTPDLAEFLSGDETAMRAAAEKLAKLAAVDKGAALHAAPVAALQSGAAAPAAAEFEDLDPAEIARRVRAITTY